MLDFITEQEKEACTILALTKTYPSLCFCSEDSTTLTQLQYLAAFALVKTVTVATAYYFKHIWL